MISLYTVPSLPLSSLRLLVSPIRLMTAFMWQVAEHHNIAHYGKLEEFVGLVSQAAPKFFNESQSTRLVIQLRTRVRSQCAKILVMVLEIV